MSEGGVADRLEHRAFASWTRRSVLAAALVHRGGARAAPQVDTLDPGGHRDRSYRLMFFSPADSRRRPHETAA